MDVRSVGVEEELLLVEPQTGHPRAVAGAILRAAGAEAGQGGREAGTPGPNGRAVAMSRGAGPGERSGPAKGRRPAEPPGSPESPGPPELEFEFQLQQLETSTQPCRSLDDLGRERRSGLDDVLVSPLTGRPERPAAVTGRLLEHVRAALADAGELDTVAELLAAVLARGNGAAFQRAVFRRSGDLEAVVTAAAAATVP